MNLLKAIVTTEEGFLPETDPQRGGLKLGEVVRTFQNFHQLKQNDLPLLLEEYAGDVIGNFGLPGAENSWNAYLRGLANLQVHPPHLGSFGLTEPTALVLGGIIYGSDLQHKVNRLIPAKRDINANRQICEITTEYGYRAIDVLKKCVENSKTVLYLGGGDRGIYQAGKALDSAHTILLRVDRHMDERSTSLRADPYDVSDTYPHSGNGVTQLKQESLVGHDFLLGVDFAANNVQCVHNSLKLYSNIPLSLVTIDILRQDERDEIDKVFDDVSEIMHMNPRARVLLNLDADTFNGIPSSAKTHTAGIDPKWAYYILRKCFSLPRPPAIIRIAELGGKIEDLPVATEFAAQCIRSILLGHQETS